MGLVGQNPRYSFGAKLASKSNNVDNGNNNNNNDNNNDDNHNDNNKSNNATLLPSMKFIYSVHFI